PAIRSRVRGPDQGGCTLFGRLSTDGRRIPRAAGAMGACRESAGQPVSADRPGEWWAPVAARAELDIDTAATTGCEPFDQSSQHLGTGRMIIADTLHQLPV